MAAKPKPISLYWVTTEGHQEDWFILARNSRQAASYHVHYEGYETGDATAERIMGIATDLGGQIPRHAQIEDLKKLGFEILRANPSGRSVRLNGRTFAEGYMEEMVATVHDNTFEARGEGRPFGTTVKRPN
jgi:hypothetical protein